MKDEYIKYHGRRYKNKSENGNTQNKKVVLNDQEITRLKNAVKMQDNQVNVLNDQLRTEANRTSTLTNSLIETKEEKDWYYKQWMQDHSKIKKWKKIAAYLLGINIVGLAIIIFRSL